MGTAKRFESEYVVRIDDINYGGHMGNERALVAFQDARIRFLEALGFSEVDVGGGLGLILAEATVHFRKEAFLHDRLAVAVTIRDRKNTSLVMHFAVSRPSDGALVFEGTTRMVAYDYPAREVKPFPAPFLDAIGPYSEN